MGYFEGFIYSVSYLTASGVCGFSPDRWTAWGSLIRGLVRRGRGSDKDVR